MKRMSRLLGFVLAVGVAAGAARAEVGVLADADGDGIPGVTRPTSEADALADCGFGPGVVEEDMIGVSWAGNNAYRLDSSACTGRLLGPTGATNLNGMARDGSGTFYAAGRGTTLWTIDPDDGSATGVATMNIGEVRGLAFSPEDVLFAIENGTPDALYTVDVNTGQATLVGPTGVSSIQALAFAPDGTLYAWDTLTFGLMTVDTNSGAATDVNPNVGGRDMQALAFAPDGTLYGGRDELYTIDTNTGEWQLCGSGGYNDVRGFEFLEGGGGKCDYTLTKSKPKKGCPSCPPKGSRYESQQACEVKQDCRKKIKTTLNCPEGPGTCKIKAKKRQCL